MSGLLPQLSIGCSAAFLTLLPIRLLKLSKESRKVAPGHSGHGKLIIAIVLSLLQLAVLVAEAFSAVGDGTRLLASVTSLVACVGISVLLPIEHTRSPKPSDLAILYLLFSLSWDTAGLVVGEYVSATSLVATLRAGSSAVKLALLVAECRSKAPVLQKPYGEWSPEDVSNILARTLFWWINPILAQGNRHVLTSHDIPPMSQGLSSKLARRRALRAWDQRARPEGTTTLPKALARSMLPPVLSPIIPRLFLIGFRYAQPVLISISIRVLRASSDQPAHKGLLVIPMAAVIYISLAISRAVYSNHISRLKVRIRGAVVGLLNNKSLTQLSSDHQDGKVVTLMSTDAESVCQAASMFHETWAHVVEVLLGTAMLARQVGWACLVPYAIIFLCSRMSRYLAKNLQSKQKDWTEATQKRLAMTTSMIYSMKSLKMLGLSPYTEDLVQRLRRLEIGAAKRVRWIMVAYNASANALGIFSPIVTFVIFVIIAGSKGEMLDTEMAFTTAALLGLITHPANMIMTIVPQAIGSLAAFKRIQDYLLKPARHDQRLIVERGEETPAIRANSVTIQPDPLHSPILTAINLTVDMGSMVVVSGPVGSGKTALVQSIMGELPIASGSISISSRHIAYCGQSPWLPSGTLRQAICGFFPEDPVWYEQVIRLCCLDKDLSALPDGDHTMIGSRGLNLSGGQRQRVALARAVYSRCDIVVLDDSLSALDGQTERTIVDNLFGPGGHFRKRRTAVLLVSNSAAHLHLADYLVVLDGGVSVYQGTFSSLMKDADDGIKSYINESAKYSKEDLSNIDQRSAAQSLKIDEAITDMKRATGDMSLYMYYFRAVGLRSILLLLLFTSSYSFFITFPQFWLQKWTEAPDSQTPFYIGGYLISCLLAWAATNGSMWTTHMLIAPRSGTELHRRLCSTVVEAPLLYFSTTDNGVILNRFSQDMQLVDKSLPPAILALSNQVFKLLVQVGLLFSAQKLMATTLPLCMLAVYLIQRVYLATSRQLRLLDLESQSAVYSSFLESTEGVETIRAFGWQRQTEAANIDALQGSQKMTYVLLCLQQWLGVVLDLMTAAIVTGLISLAVLIKGTTTASQIGMALNIVIVTNTTLLGLVTSWTNLEISLSAISRLKTLEADTPREDKPHEDYLPADTWPTSGSLELDTVAAGYSKTPSLQDITVDIPAGQQLVICGRTGSGKSTLLLTLLRLPDIHHGTIRVDGVDLSLVPRTLVRQRCFITISQDVLLLGQASLRFNLDPSGCLSDEAIVEALQRMSMWSHFTTGGSPPRDSRKILDRPLSSSPQMSAGQYQLFSVARAILRLQAIRKECSSRDSRVVTRKIKPIILLDEATSSLDGNTAASVNDIIREEFIDKGHTVIAITHRTSGITKSRKLNRAAVAVLSDGKVEKYGSVEDVLG